MTTETAARAEAIIAAALAWDSHAGFAFESAADLEEMTRWRRSGFSHVSVNIGYDAVPWTLTMEALSKYRDWIRTHGDEVVQVTAPGDAQRAKAEGRLAIAFDIEGANALNGDAGMVDVFYRLGVRQMLFAYNRNNLAAGGCHDEDAGLTAFGRDVLSEMNRVGMVVDCSHCGYRSSMDLLEHSATAPVFSHSNARALCDHERNIRDDQAKACARRGGVIGVTGVGLFLGPRGADPTHVVEHIDYYCDLVGAEHVGIGLDSILLNQKGEEIVGASSHFWPARQYPAGPIGFVPPEALPAIVGGFVDRGYPEAAIAGIIGGNFARIAADTWKPVEA